MTELPKSATGLKVRLCSVRIYRTVLDQHRTLEDALERDEAVAELDGRDRAFLINLLRTIFRHLGEIEAIKASHLTKALPKKSGSASDILTVGIAQLLFLDTPAHAAIDMSVRMAKADRNATHFSGLINAVLRKVSSAGNTSLDANRLNTPDWLWKRWVKTYGEAIAAEIAASHRREPPLDISVKSDGAAWAEKLGGQLLPTGQVRLAQHRGLISALPGFAEGEWWVQDAAASLPVLLMGELQGRTALDICAAPGGKTMQLAAAGAIVTAVDISAERLKRLRENLERTGLMAKVVEADGTSLGMSERFDAVLLDAPCSATGTIRRHPELPYIRKDAPTPDHCATQRVLLTEAADRVKPGGSLVYCTCSLEPEEGEKQISWFRAAFPHFTLVPAGSVIPAELRTAEGWLRLLPSMNIGNSQGMDGFFMARLDRTR